jgi:membrane protein implicated in regulation of membrane protease activity
VLFVLAVVAAILWLRSPLGWILVGVAAAVEIGQTFFWVWWSGKRKRAKVGVEALLGRQAVVVLPCRPEGQVRVDGERWRARCAEGADPGETVTVEAVEGLTLVVAPYGATRPFATNAS